MQDIEPDNLDATLSAALLAPEDGVPEPTSRRPHSFTGQIASLSVGEVACRLYPLDLNMTLEDMAQSLTQLRAKCRNNAAPSVRRATERTGGEYTTEVCEFVAPRGQVYIATIVTRTT